MIEIEIKAKADHEAVWKILKQAGAAMEKTVNQSDSYYNAPDRDFGQTDEALRLRDQEGQVYLTYKGKKMDAGSKTRKEVEVEVADLKKMEEILLSLGFKKTLEVHKVREIYHLEGAEICLDHVEGLGDFVELEVLAIDSSEIDNRRDSIIALKHALGIPGELIRESYLEMLLSKKAH